MPVRLLRSLILLASSTLLFSSNSWGACNSVVGVPCPVTSLLPCSINLVGSTAGVADPLGNFTVTVADGNSAAVIGADVWIDFTSCCNDIRLSSTQLGPGMILGPGKTVHGITGTGGVVTFRIMGAASNFAVTPMSGCALVYAQTGTTTVLLTDFTSHPFLQVGAYDLNGALGGGAGVGAADFAIWLNDFFSATNPPRSDYDFSVLCMQSVGPADLSLWQNVFFGGGSTGNGAGFLTCP